MLHVREGGAGTGVKIYVLTVFGGEGKRMQSECLGELKRGFGWLPCTLIYAVGKRVLYFGADVCFANKYL